MVWEIDAAPTRFLAPPYRHGVNEGRRDRDSNLVLGAAEVRINDTMVTVPALCANCEDSSAVVLSGLGSAAFVLAVYLRSSDCSDSTQDSLPAGGWPLPDGL